MWEDRAVALDVLKKQIPVGIDAEEFTPWASTLDIEAVADAFGLQKVDIVAHSFGTHLTMAAMKRIPQRLGKIVFLGFEGPDQTYKLPSVFANCPEPPAGPDFGLRWMLGSWFGLENRMRRYLEFTENPSKFLAGFEKVLAKRSPVFYLMDAASGASEKRWQKIRANSGRYSSTINFPFPEISEAYGVTLLPDSFREDPVWDHPMLIFTGEKDVFTPTSNFVEVGRNLRNAVHEEIKGAYHDTLLLSEKIAQKWMPFFVED